MSLPGNVTTRYNDDDLREFKDLITSKLDKARDQYANLKEQLKDITENNNDDFAKDITDFSSIQSEVEMLNNMANHQRKYIQDLDNALIRINNKSYGICVVTGELIDKKRLVAVPTTTKSVLAKTQSEMKDVQVVPKDKMRGFDDLDDEDDDRPAKRAEPKKPTIISKVVKKPTAKKVVDVDDDDLDKLFDDLDVIKELDEADLSLDEDDEAFDDDDTDLDMIADEESEEYDEEEDED